MRAATYAAYGVGGTTTPLLVFFSTTIPPVEKASFNPNASTATASTDLPLSSCFTPAARSAPTKSTG